MFIKPYKYKSTNTLKNTEKKVLIQRILDTFPAANEENIKELIVVKSTVTCVKLVTHFEESVFVYTVNGVPFMLELQEILVPLLFALWTIPDLLPSITIHQAVLPKLLNGAPLYLPGIVVPNQGVGFPMYARGQLLAANTTDNSTAAVIGRATMGSSDILLNFKGVSLEPIHIYGDLLCQDQRFSKMKRPQLVSAVPAPIYALDTLASSVGKMSVDGSRTDEEWPALGSSPAPPPAEEPSKPHVTPPLSTDRVEDEEEEEIPSDMDGLLRWSLLAFLKREGKHLELPLKTNLLYKNHLIPLCPPDRTIDVKKSTFKKMGKFLEAMEREGLLQVKEVEKGVSAVVGVNPAHPLVRAAPLPAHLHPPGDAPPPAAAHPQNEYVPPIVREVFCVTAAVAGLFPGVKKGTSLQPSAVRSAVTEYVRARSLTCPERRGALTLDDTLAKLLGKQTQEVVSWEEVMSGVCGRMTAATELGWADGATRLVKSRLEPITMKVATRSGNKKVTLVSNLEQYGFTLPELARACQLGVGASCGVTRSPGARADQLMLQGDQTYFVARLLIEQYKLPKKFVEGADKALSKK